MVYHAQLLLEASSSTAGCFWAHLLSTIAPEAGKVMNRATVVSIARTSTTARLRQYHNTKECFLSTYTTSRSG